MPYDDIKRDRIFERIAGSLERIADALEKQNAGQYIQEDSNGPCATGSSQKCSL